MLKIFVLVILAAGCREELNLRIDANCTDDQREKIVAAVAEINDAWYGCHPSGGINIVGRVVVTNYDNVNSPEAHKMGDDDDWVLCVPAGEKIIDDYPANIWGQGAYAGNVTLFQSKIPEDQFYRFALHELMHYIGVDDLDGDPLSIMHQGAPKVDRLAESDIALMCEMD
jgi:hypothetical protein